jgi:predicted metal-dependent phosphoesterase TrpH
MRKHLVDFHTHTNFSDGALSLAELVKRAKDASLELIVVSDHDTFRTFSPANIELAKQSIPDLKDCGDTYQTGNLKIVKGVEFSANHNGRQIHIVGAYLKQVSPKIQEYFGKIGEERKERAQKLADRMNVNFEDVLRVAGNATSITRLHVGRVIYDSDKRNPVRVINDKRYLRYSSAHDVAVRLIPRKHKDYLPVSPEVVMSSFDAVNSILEHGGIPIWAHPAMEKLPLEETMEELQTYANDRLFVEGYSGNCSDRENKRVAQVARQLGIPMLKSSDFHGLPMKDNKLGYILRHPEYKTIMKTIKKTLNGIRP